MPDALEATYLAYLNALNDRRFGDLENYVHDELTYNDEVFTRQHYADMIAADGRAVPDLHAIHGLWTATFTSTSTMSRSATSSPTGIPRTWPSSKQPSDTTPLGQCRSISLGGSTAPRRFTN